MIAIGLHTHELSKPFPSRGNGFLFEKVTEKVTAGATFPKIGRTFQPFFLLRFRFMDVLLFKVVVVPSIGLLCLDEIELVCTFTILAIHFNF